MAQQAQANLRDFCDAVVMLTWSDWFTEPVGNRYHYATRFARHVPVVFVQPDLMAENYFFEPTQTENITVLHIPERYDETQRAILDAALAGRRIARPLLWVYNLRFHAYVQQCPAVLKVLHATEDYTHFANAADLVPRLKATLAGVDAAVAVTPRVLASLRQLDAGRWKPLLLPNGCDYKFWGLSPAEVEEVTAQPGQKTMVFPGWLRDNVDYALLEELAVRMPGWTLQLIGAGPLYKQTKRRFAKHKNIQMPGAMPLAEVRRRCMRATVGLLPYVHTEQMRSTLPLKAYEYLAVGLPVVFWSGIEMLKTGPDADCFTPADDAAGFAAQIAQVAEDRYDKAKIHAKMERAAAADYENRFAGLLEEITPLIEKRAQSGALPQLLPQAGPDNYGLDCKRGKRRERRVRRRFQMEKIYSEHVDPNSRLHKVLKKLLRR